MSLGNLAVKYLLQFDMVSTVLPAMNSVEEVLENLKLKAVANPSKELYRAPARHYQCPAAPNRRNIRGIVRDLQATGAFP